DDDVRSPLGPRLFNLLCFCHKGIPFAMLYPLSSILNGFLVGVFFIAASTLSVSASRAEPLVEQKSRRTSVSRSEIPPISPDAFRAARPMGTWQYQQSYIPQRGIPSYRVADPRLCKAAALLCDSGQWRRGLSRSDGRKNWPDRTWARHRPSET